MKNCKHKNTWGKVGAKEYVCYDCGSHVPNSDYKIQKKALKSCNGTEVCLDDNCEHDSTLLDEVVRDLCSVDARTKSKTREILEAYTKKVREETLKMTGYNEKKFILKMEKEINKITGQLNRLRRVFF